MPDLSQTQPATFPLEGGLVLNKPTMAMAAGEALELQNFEPDINGGYRRINGFAKYNANIVPQTPPFTSTFTYFGNVGLSMVLILKRNTENNSGG